MYTNDTANWSAKYAQEHVSRIVSKLVVCAPVTVFAPSGFGKSILLNYIAYNCKYRKRYRLRNTLIAYVDATEIVASITQNLPETGSQPIVSKILAAGVRKTLSQAKLPVPASEDIISLLEWVFTRNKNLRLFLIVDGLEQLTGEQFSHVREQLKYTRDTFRNHLDYIFGIGTAQAMQITREKYGTLSTLIGQQTVIINLPQKTTEVYRTLYSQPVWLSWLRVPLLRKRFAYIDQVSGGYPPYIKYLLRAESTANGNMVPLEQEIIIASKRLLQSLTSEMSQLLSKLAHNIPVNTQSNDYIMLNTLGIINQGKVFSPILENYLKSNATLNPAQQHALEN